MTSYEDVIARAFTLVPKLQSTNTPVAISDKFSITVKTKLYSPPLRTGKR
jgi:hypothetical protein